MLTRFKRSVLVYFILLFVIYFICYSLSPRSSLPFFLSPLTNKRNRWVGPKISSADGGKDRTQQSEEGPPRRRPEKHRNLASRSFLAVIDQSMFPPLPPSLLVLTSYAGWHWRNWTTYTTKSDATHCPAHMNPKLICWRRLQTRISMLNNPNVLPKKRYQYGPPLSFPLFFCFTPTCSLPPSPFFYSCFSCFSG